MTWNLRDEIAEIIDTTCFLRGEMSQEGAREAADQIMCLLWRSTVDEPACGNSVPEGADHD